MEISFFIEESSAEMNTTRLLIAQNKTKQNKTKQNWLTLIESSITRRGYIVYVYIIKCLKSRPVHKRLDFFNFIHKRSPSLNFAESWA